MFLQNILGMSLLALLCTVSGCSDSVSQPTSKVRALVKYRGAVLTDVRMDVFQQVAAEWKIVLSGIPVVAEPFYLLPVPKAPDFDPKLPTRVTLESIGHNVLPIKSIYLDPIRSPIKLLIPSSSTDPIVVELPDGAIGK
ncbi:MAG: hypothetical protein ACOVLE_02710 [Pirellula staleyi]